MNGWLTVVTMLVLCAGGSFMAAPQLRLPPPAAKLQSTISGGLHCKMMHNASMTVMLACDELEQLH